MVLSHTVDHSCGIHDTQSCFRLPIQKCIGTGDLVKENAFQFLYTIYSLYSELKECWYSLSKKAYLCITTDNNNYSDITIPKVLLTAIQELLMTRWWSIGEIATVSSAYIFFFVKMAQTAANCSKSNDKVNVIASNIICMSKSAYIINNVHLGLAFTNSWLNKHMNCYQQNDCNAQTACVYLSIHRPVKYFIQLNDVVNIQRNWSTSEIFERYKSLYESMNTNMKTQKDRHVIICLLF